MKALIGIIDYGMGNLHSVQKAISRLNQNIKFVREPKDLEKCDALILPGVGSFDPAMESLQKTGLIPHITSWANENKPLLGICLGLQLLFESSDEGQLNGLGILKGRVKKLPQGIGERLPHMGWAVLTQKNPCPLLLEEDIPKSWMYFVHSYSAVPENPSNLAATTRFGDIPITAIVWQRKLGACQFHPEKSSKAGEKLLLNWINWLNKDVNSFS